MEYLPATWFQRPAVAVAPDLLGCVLVRQFPGNPAAAENRGTSIRGQIVETEAYEPGDPACHAYRRRTPRNAAMFAAGGHSYIYLIYGIHHCFNVVTDQVDRGSAVLIRALSLESLPHETPPASFHRLAAGPGKLCKVLALDRSLNHRPLTPETGLWIEPRSPDLDAAIQTQAEPIVQTTRIGLSQGVDLPWRWYLERSRSVSRR